MKLLILTALGQALNFDMVMEFLCRQLSINQFGSIMAQVDATSQEEAVANMNAELVKTQQHYGPNVTLEQINDIVLNGMMEAI